MTTDIPPPYEHQETTANFMLNNNLLFNTSDTGTGKTRATLEGFARRQRAGKSRRMLVLGPLSILEPAWFDDCRRWTPHLSCGVSTAGSNKKRLTAFEDNCDIVITNHDAVTWLVKNKNVLQDFDTIVVDESTAFKHHTAARSKALRELVKPFVSRTMMTGTPNSNGICDVWHQAYLLDEGERLGKMFHGFRMQVCTPVQVGPERTMVKWMDKPGAEEMVAERLRDISLRFRFEDCIDIPPNTLHEMFVTLPPKLLAQYEHLQKTSTLDVEQGRISAIHAGIRANKLLQLCSGAVYGETDVEGERDYILLDTSRYELVMQLVAEREHSVVAFTWKHQKDQLTRLADRMGISYAVIDGSVPNNERTEIVRDYQKGRYQTLFAHPRSAAHGLTLTRGRTTIWPSPTHNAEWFQQFNARIYRSGQTQSTETILIAARDTRELDAYEVLQGKRKKMFDFLSIFTDTTKDIA